MGYLPLWNELEADSYQYPDLIKGAVQTAPEIQLNMAQNNTDKNY